MRCSVDLLGRPVERGAAMLEAYAKNGNKQEAQRSLEQALKLNPSFAGADDAKRVLGTLKG